MPAKTVTVIIFNDKDEVLLHQREDFRIWSLPGGHIDAGESWPQAAVREVYEETGYQIVVSRWVGEYYQPQMPYDGGEIKYVCLGHVVGGEPIAPGHETVQVKWFSLANLPFRFSQFMREYIQDTKQNEIKLIKRTQLMPFYQMLTTRYLIKLRNLRNKLLHRP